MLIILFILIFAYLLRIDLRNFVQIDATKAEEKFSRILYKRFYLIVIVLTLCISVLFEYRLILTLVLATELFYYLRQRRLFQEEIVGKEETIDEKLLIIKDACGVIIHWLGWMFGMALVAFIFLEFFPHLDTDMNDAIFSTIVSSVLIIVLIYQASFRFGSNFWSNINYKAGHLNKIKSWFMPMSIGSLFALLSAIIVTNRIQEPDTPMSQMLEQNQSSSAMIIFIILALITAPLVEEIIFRGYFYKVLQKVKGARFAIICLALMFGILHYHQYWGDFAAMVMVTLLGFVLTWMRFKTKSVMPSVVMHYSYNIGVTVFAGVFLMLGNPSYFKYQAYYEEYDFQEREELLTEGIKKEPFRAEIYHELAWLYHEENKHLEEGLRLINRALYYDEDNTKYLDTKIKLLIKLDKNDEARELIEHRRELNSDRPLDNVITVFLEEES